MGKKKPDATELAEDVVPDLLPPPTITRKFKPQPWYRPRKQYLRKYQWNHEIIEQIIRKRPGSADVLLRVLGLPSSEYLDLLSMQDMCEEHGVKIVYLGFNSSYKPASAAEARTPGPIDLYHELQAQRMIEVSSFVHPSSRIVPDLFEHIRTENTMSRNVLKTFGEFDVINLDLCGCIVDPDEHKATDALNAVVELLRWQSTRRLSPWLFFVTTFASPEEINRPACMPLMQAIKDNAGECPEFSKELEAKAGLNADGILACFEEESEHLPEVSQFIRIFALAVGKWLAARLCVPTPPSLAAMLPGYCFRHENHADPHLLSLAFLIKPSPSPGESGILSRRAALPDLNPEYRKHARKMIAKSFEITDLDKKLQSDHAKRKEAADKTAELLVSSGFDETAVEAYLGSLR